MSLCSVCGKPVRDASLFTCSYCEGAHCSTHRLPESHECPEIASAQSLGPDLGGQAVARQGEVTFEASGTLGTVEKYTCQNCGRTVESDKDRNYCPICRSEGIEPNRVPPSPDPAEMMRAEADTDEGANDEGAFRVVGANRTLLLLSAILIGIALVVMFTGLL